MNLRVSFFSEVTPNYFALWTCMDPAKQDGYRVRFQNEASIIWSVIVEKATGGVYSTLGEGTVELEEGFHSAKVTVSGGAISVMIDGVTRASGSDASYTEGHVGIEGNGNATFGEVDFTVNGVLLDSMKRTENPLATAEWTALSWAEDAGRCYNETFGWTPAASEHSGAYWNVREFATSEEGGGEEEHEEGGGGPLASGVTRAAIPR